MTTRPWRTLFIAIGFIVIAAGAAADSASDWRDTMLERIAEEPLPLGMGEARARPPSPRVSPPRSEHHRLGLGLLLRAPILFHRKIISPQDGDRCTFRPTCSTYALSAVREYGPFGWVMASERLLRAYPGNWDAYDHVDGLKYDPVPAPGEERLDPGRAVLGGTLSLVPGLGQIAAGRWRDGLYALGSVGVLTFGAAHYAREDKNVPAAIAGSLAAFFYVGNLYGGARALGRTSGP